jgi:transcriptional regulator with XRE-family HTH domain
MMVPGERIRMLRIILGISREDFCKKYGINFNTLTSIELNRSKISSKQLTKIIEAFLSEGVYVEKLWIMEAKGNPPTRMLIHTPQAQGDFLENWARFFEDNRNAVIHQIKGDHMEPFYSADDLVGGLWNSAPNFLLGKRCIVQYNQVLYLGILFHHKDVFSLTPVNPKNHHTNVLFPMNAVRVAEVFWHIRKQSYQIPEIASLEMMQFASST